MSWSILKKTVFEHFFLVWGWGNLLISLYILNWHINHIKIWFCFYNRCLSPCLLAMLWFFPLLKRLWIKDIPELFLPKSMVYEIKDKLLLVIQVESLRKNLAKFLWLQLVSISDWYSHHFISRLTPSNCLGLLGLETLQTVQGWASQ